MKNLLLYIKFATIFAVNNKTLRHVRKVRTWYKDTKSKDSPLSRRLPWMTYDAIGFLLEICNSEMNVFEWGSGGSTLFFGQKCKQIISVEHDLNWKHLVELELKQMNLNNITQIGIMGEKDEEFHKKDYRKPDDYISIDKNSSGLSFEKYVKIIDDFPENHFDIILVDGRARNSCIKRAIPHLRKEGYLIVDNSDRKYYIRPFPELNNSIKWHRFEFQGPIFFQHAFSRTSFFKKLY